MIIAPEYIAKISQSQSELSDEEFLVQSIWYAKSFFANELVFVKNIRCEFIAFSEKASLEFDLSHDILGKTFYAAANIHKLVQDEIYQHELQLLNDRKMQNSFYFYNKNEEIVATSVTNFDIHDISRTSKTYGVEGYYIVTPVDAQQELTKRIIGFLNALIVILYLLIIILHF